MPTESKPVAPPPPSNALGSRNTIETSVSRFLEQEAHNVSDVLAVEEPLEIQLGYGTGAARHVKSISVTMRTPGHDFEFRERVSIGNPGPGTLERLKEKIDLDFDTARRVFTLICVLHWKG